MIWIKQGSILNWNIYRGDIMLDDFIKVMAMPKDVVEKYRTMVPDELIQIWQNQGIGTFLGGYLKIINPDNSISLKAKNTVFSCLKKTL